MDTCRRNRRASATIDTAAAALAPEALRANSQRAESGRDNWSAPKNPSRPWDAPANQDVAPEAAPAKKRSVVLRVLGWCALLLAGLVGMTIGKPIGKEIASAILGGSRAEQMEQALKKAEAVARAELPKKLDDVTTMVAVDHEGNRLRFSYVLDLRKQAFSPTLLQTVRAQILPKLCAEKSTNGLNAGIVFDYAYRDPQAKSLGSFSIAKGDCSSAS